MCFYVTNEQCGQMATLFAQTLAIYNKDNLHKKAKMLVSHSRFQIIKYLAKIIRDF